MSYNQESWIKYLQYRNLRRDFDYWRKYNAYKRLRSNQVSNQKSSLFLVPEKTMDKQLSEQL